MINEVPIAWRKTNFFYLDFELTSPMSFALAHRSNENKAKDSEMSNPAKSHPSTAIHQCTNCCAMDSHDSDFVHLQLTNGNQAVQKPLHSGAGFDFAKIGILQPKLKISHTGDENEQGADKVAGGIMRMPTSDSIAQMISKKEEGIDRKSNACETKEDKEEDEKQLHISPKPSTTSTLEENEEITNEVNNVLSIGGSSLDASTREFMESRFGYDFSNVKIHTGESAARSVRSVDALAYTVGNDIVFGAGMYMPGTMEGRKLLAHELTHVVQQRDTSGPAMQRDCSDPNFCKPYATRAEADSAEWWIRNVYMPLEGRPTYGTEVKALYETFLSRKPGDSLAPILFDSDSSYLVSSFKNSGDTRDDMDNVIDLVGSRLSRAPGPPLRDNIPTMMSLSNFLYKSEMENRPINYSNPFSVAGHIAGAIGSSDAGADYRKITYANVTLEKTTLIGSTGYISVELTPHYEVFDAIDFCPGDCGSIAEQVITIPMSRLEASGAAYDVPFKVSFTPESRSKRFWF